MCAINGFNFQDEDLILKMNKENRHRGPDGTGFWLGDGVSFGHNRLSIIDLSERGKQPMMDASSRLTIVFNGEIYNYQDLRDQFFRDYPFQSESDTEVILAAYAKWGIDCLKYFNGIFAFAIWDAVKKELFLARDPIGVKPLYYFYDGQRLIFSSEIKSILVHSVVREVDPEAFNLYFHVLYVPEPHTMFRGIKKLPPASYLRFGNAGLEVKKYWRVEDFDNLSSRSAAIEQIQNLFKDSVRRQLISDRPVGIFLSGGLDSTAVLAASREYLPTNTKSFAVGFETNVDSEKFNADFYLARRTAQFYGIDHLELMIGAREVLENLEKIVWHLDEPNFNPTAAAIFLLSRLAKEKVAVVLGGDGGDELFGGYPRYALSSLIGEYRRWPAITRSMLEAGLVVAGKKSQLSKLRARSGTEVFLEFLSQKQELLEEAISRDFVRRDSVDNYFGNHFFSRVTWPGGDFEKYFMNTDRQSWLVDESLLRTDKMAMAFGLEERVPILDYRLVELANKIPTQWKIHQRLSTLWGSFQGKRIWREAIRQYLPPHIVSQQKRGWFTPMAKWLRTDFRDRVSEIIESGLNPNFLNQKGMKRIWKDHLSGKRYNLNIIWAVVMWQLWYNSFIKK